MPRPTAPRRSTARRAAPSPASDRAPAALPAARREALRRRLLAWYDAAQRPLPWRDPPGRQGNRGAPAPVDPYRVWLVEAMAQQTQVARLIPFYQRFLARLPTLEALAAASEAEVLSLWAGLGYYARARALRRAAVEALARHGGLPEEPAALRALPGIGPYTAGAVASIAFGRQVAAVDGNAARVLSRLFLVEGPPEAPAVRARIQALAEALVPAGRPGDWNQAVMELGATRCVKPVPACGGCPLEGGCEARRAGREREVPPARRRPPRTAARLHCALLVRRGRVLLVRRASAGLFGGLWALPSVEGPGRPVGAPARGDEAGRLALEGTLAALTGPGARVGPVLGAVRRALTHRELELVAHEARGPAGRRAWEGGAEGRPERRWARREELGRMGVPAAFLALLDVAWPDPERPPRPLWWRAASKGAGKGLHSTPEFK